MTLSAVLPSLCGEPSYRTVLWPSAVHRHGGRMTLRDDDRGGHEWYLDSLCDRHGDTVTVVLDGAQRIAIGRVRSVDVLGGSRRVTLAGSSTGLAVAAARLASRRSLARLTPACLCTTTYECLCPALDLPADTHEGDVLALVTGTGASPLRGQPISATLVART